MEQTGRIMIGGIPYKIIECSDRFDADAKHFGQVDFMHAEISINSDMEKNVKEETLTHEIMHAILVHIGRSDLSADETFVQSLANAVYQTFEARVYQTFTMEKNADGR